MITTYYEIFYIGFNYHRKFTLKLLTERRISLFDSYKFSYNLLVANFSRCLSHESLHTENCPKLPLILLELLYCMLFMAFGTLARPNDGQ